MRKLEVGSVYRLSEESESYAIAVRADLLVRVVKGEIVEFSQTEQLISCRNISIHEICYQWDCSPKQLDEITRIYLQPERHRDYSVRQRRSSSRLSPDEEILRTRQLRQFRLGG